MRIHYPTVIIGLSLIITACDESPATDGEVPDIGAYQPVAEMTGLMSEPDTTAASILAYLEDEDYAASWPLWPGTDPFYTGEEPHGMLLTSYTNSVANAAIRSDAGVLPPGSMIVKENYAEDSMLVAVTVMYKAASYDTEHNDWFFLKRLADGTVEASGRVASCQACHRAAMANDYIMTAPLAGDSAS